MLFFISLVFVPGCISTKDDPVIMDTVQQETSINKLIEQKPTTNKQPLAAPTNKRKMKRLKKLEAKQNNRLKTYAKIKRKDLGHKPSFFIPKQYPKEFRIKVNGTPVFQLNKKEIVKDGTHEISVKDGTLTVVYDYLWEWPGGRREGTRKAIFKVPAHKKNVNITFSSWMKPNRMVIDGVEQVADEVDLVIDGVEQTPIPQV